MRIKVATHEVLAVIKLAGAYTLYAGAPDFWVMDLRSRRAEFVEHGWEVPVFDATERLGFLQLDVDVAAAFVDALAPQRITTETLARLLEEAVSESWEDIYHLYPVVLLDFDARVVWTTAHEEPRYDRHLPAGWAARREDFYGELPVELSRLLRRTS